MTSDYKICINCVGKKIQNMIPIHIYINVRHALAISISVDKRIQDVILFSMIGFRFFEGSHRKLSFLGSFTCSCMGELVGQSWVEVQY